MGCLVFLGVERTRTEGHVFGLREESVSKVLTELFFFVRKKHTSQGGCVCMCICVCVCVCGSRFGREIFVAREIFCVYAYIGLAIL